MQAYNLSRDHKPDLEAEKERILKAGGFIHAGRVNGSLNLARAIGTFLSDLSFLCLNFLCLQQNFCSQYRLFDMLSSYALNFNWEKLWSRAFPEGGIQITLTKRLRPLSFHFRIIPCIFIYVCMICMHTHALVGRYIVLCSSSSFNASVSVFC